MIISHRHRFIFIAVPKTATHAIRQALRPQLGEDDLEQVGLFVKKQFPFPALREIPHGHISALQIRPVLGEALFGGYFKFGFVRHPFERFVSYCAFLAKRSGAFESAPTAFMRHVAFELRPFQHVVFRPQHEFLADADGRLLVDQVGRQEQLQSDYEAICARLGLPAVALERVNESRHAHWAGYYDEPLKDWVRQFYRRDFELFGYDPA
ncbi:MAG TPA: sulfotransferase family 2 domain-containing protein [Nevskiaceae bacterium]|nr:sulfotransferase family 2 domain-containing protein [Nevskiaceae bacterium]